MDEDETRMTSSVIEYGDGESCNEDQDKPDKEDDDPRRGQGWSTSRTRRGGRVAMRIRRIVNPTTRIRTCLPAPRRRLNHVKEEDDNPRGGERGL